MKNLILALFTLLVCSTSCAEYNGCVLIAVNASQRAFYSQFGAVPGFGPGCLVVQQDTSVVYEWNGSSYMPIGGPGAGIQSLNSQTGGTQIFANDANIIITSSNNTHTLGWASTLSMARGGSGAALTASNGGVVYSSASAMAILAPGTSGQVLKSNGAGAPSWGAASSSAPQTYVYVDDVGGAAPGDGTVNQSVRYFAHTVAGTNADMTLVNSTTLGTSVTILTAGIYCACYGDAGSAAASEVISLNAVGSEITEAADASGVTSVHRLGPISTITGDGSPHAVCACRYCAINDIIRPQSYLPSQYSQDLNESFQVTRMY